MQFLTKICSGSYAFGFWPVWAFGGSFAVVIFAFGYPHEHPPVIAVNAAAGQLFLLQNGRCCFVFLGLRHKSSHQIFICRINVLT
jgi:hypothetical protein